MDREFRLFFAGFVVGAVVVYFFLQQKTLPDIPELRKHDMDDNEIKDIVETLLDKLDSMSKVDTKLKNKLDALEQISGVRGEQIKYLTSNANKSA